jgi:hypothetical protein
VRSTLIPLPDVAHRLALPWAAAWALLLRGQLQGEKRGGRWYVTTASVEKLRRRRAEAEAAVASSTHPLEAA